MPEQLRAVENSHKAKGYPESPFTHEHICYHYFIGSDGTIVQTRGINEREGLAGGCTLNEHVNERAVQIVLAGDFNSEDPSERQLKSLKKLVTRLQRRYGIENSHVIGHKEASSTSCPGERLISLLYSYRTYGSATPPRKLHAREQ